MTHILDGINTYKVKPLVMKKHNADLVLRRLRRKINNKQALTRQDLAMLPMLPVMSGDSSLLGRMKEAFSITTIAADHISKEDISKIEAATYAMATKFLSNEELADIRSVVTMTYLGQLIYEDGFAKGHNEGRNEGRKKGREEGREEGREVHLKEQVAKKRKKGKSISEIANELEETEELIHRIYNELSEEQH